MSIFFEFFKVPQYVCQVSNQSVVGLYPEKWKWNWFYSLPLQQPQWQNMSLRIGLIELIEPSDKLNYKSFFRYCIFQTALHVFIVHIFNICVERNLLFKKCSLILHLFHLIWGWIRCTSVKGTVFLVLFV